MLRKTLLKYVLEKVVSRSIKIVYLLKQLISYKCRRESLRKIQALPFSLKSVTYGTVQDLQNITLKNYNMIFYI